MVLGLGPSWIHGMTIMQQEDFCCDSYSIYHENHSLDGCHLTAWLGVRREKTKQAFLWNMSAQKDRATPFPLPPRTKALSQGSCTCQQSFASMTTVGDRTSQNNVRYDAYSKHMQLLVVW